MLRKSILGLLCTNLIAVFAIAQVGSGTLKGTITDKNSGEPLPFANVVVLQGDQQMGGAATDFDGRFTIKPINPGNYNVKCFFVGYNDKIITDVKINSSRITFLDIAMESGVNLEEVIITGYKVPLIDKDGGASGGTVTREDISKMPGRSATSIATTVGGVSTAGTGGGVSIRGARTSDTFYYIDGVKVRGSVNLPKSAIEEVSVITGGIPANFGDATGGIINITTRGASSKFFGGVDLLSSGFKSGDEVIGLDHYGETQIEGYLSGPIAFKKDSAGNKLDPFLGFFVSGNFRKTEDTRPSAIGNWYLKNDVKEELQANPITPITNPDGSQFIIYNSDFLHLDDFENVPTRKNSDVLGASLTAKFDITPTPLVNVSVGGSANYFDANNYSFAGSLLNYQNNSISKELTWRAFARFTQRFSNAVETKESSSTVKNAYYSVMIDYSKVDGGTEDRNHQDNFFNYGYVGNYKTYSIPNYAFVDTLGGGSGNGFVQDGFLDTLIFYTPGTANPDLAQVSSAFFNAFGPDGNYRNFEDILGSGGLINGGAPPSAYSLWVNNAVPSGTYNLYDNSQFRLSASGSADVDNHAIQVGFEYEQRSDRGFALNPIGLWTRARQKANFHIQEIDYSQNPEIVFENGFYFYNYPRLVGSDQSAFDLNLRNALNLDPNGTDYIYVDELDPEFLSLDMFSANDLLDQGSNALVSYFGYDHTGNRTSNNPSFDDFFNEVGDDGQLSRSIGAFEPIYMSGFVMDKFAFDDIIFNVGLRVDRYDANQQVLKDDYIVGDFYTVGNNPQFSDHPANIGDDYVIYVNDLENPTGINGYRDGDDWFNSEGTAVSDPSILRTPNGIAPYLVNTSETLSNLSSDAFEDYTPAISVMPRIAFSFPISDEALFFAHYDILTQRPSGFNRLNPIDYLFIATRTNEINNPNLQPSKTIDYELGFQQVLSRTSSLKISAFYREMRDMVTSRFLSQAWPRQYITYRNVDFGTVKGFTLGYDLRKTGNVWMRANYTMQFANGTGSDATSNLNLSRFGEPSLRTVIPLNFDQRHAVNVTMDYRYGNGTDYNGLIIGGKQIFANTGLNLVANMGSGTPYSAAQGVASINGIGSTGLDGSPNGSRLPFQFLLNGQIDKDIALSFGGSEGEKAKRANLNIYLLVNNILNTNNIIGVYGTTGDPDDDGYLVTGLAEQDVNSRISPESYVDLYRLALQNPFNYGLARTIQLGIKFDF